MRRPAVLKTRDLHAARGRVCRLPATHEIALMRTGDGVGDGDVIFIGQHMLYGYV